MAVIPLQITSHEGIDRLPAECLIRLASSSSSECGHHYHFTIIGVLANGSDGLGSRWVSPVISAWPSLNRFGLATRNKINMDIKCCIIDKCNHRVLPGHSAAHILPHPSTIGRSGAQEVVVVKYVIDLPVIVQRELGCSGSMEIWIIVSSKWSQTLLVHTINCYIPLCDTCTKMCLGVFDADRFINIAKGIICIKGVQPAAPRVKHSLALDQQTNSQGRTIN